MNLASLALAVALPSAAAVVDVQSPAMRQLQDIEAQRPDETPAPDAAKAGSAMGFTVKTLAPVGQLVPGGAPADSAAPTAPGVERPRYVFEGKSAIKGVTVYTPKPDPSGEGKTEPPKEKLGGGLLMYGALAVGAGMLLAGVSFWIVAALALAALAALFFVNRKTA